MSTIAHVYARRLQRDFRYYYTHWLPNATLEVGDVGELVDGCLFRPLSSLERMGVAFDPATDVVVDDDPSPMKFVSSSGVSTTVKLAGEVNPNMPNIPQGSAGLKLAFSSEGAFTIEARESYEHRIAHVPGIEQQILELYREGRWPRHYVVVFSLVKGPYVDVIISETASSSIELEVQAQGQVGKVELGDAQLQFGVRHTSGRVLDMRGGQNVAPICQLIGLKRRWPGPWKPGPLGRGIVDLAAADMDELVRPPNDVRAEDYGLALLGADSPGG